MSQDRPTAPSAASIKATAADLYGLALDDKQAARIAGELGQLAAGAKGAGTVPADAAPVTLFRQLLLASDTRPA